MLLELKDVRLNLAGPTEDVAVLNGISANFEAGKVSAILGPSGSGKTSLIMICAGLLKPTSGAVLFEGQDIATWDEDALADLRRDKIGIVFQNYHLIPTMNALENVAIPMELAKIANAQNKAREILENVGLGLRAEHYPSQLSGGEQQRVAVARALGMKPALILADEPTGNLDEKTGQSVIALLFEQARMQNAGLVMVTHDMQLAAKCDVQVHIKDGVVV